MTKNAWVKSFEKDLSVLLDYVKNSDREKQDYENSCEENGWEFNDFYNPNNNHVYAIAHRLLNSIDMIEFSACDTNESEG